MKKWIVLLLFGGGLVLFAQKPAWEYVTAENELKVILHVPKGMYFHSSATHVMLTDPAGIRLPVSVVPAGQPHRDELSGEKVMIYPGPGAYQWVFRMKIWTYPLQLEVGWQGCSDGETATCFMPEKVSVKICEKAAQAVAFYGKPAIQPIPVAESGFPEFMVLRTGTGAMDKPEFLRFLKGETSQEANLFAGKSFLLILLLCFLGGAALNLTPCVLPMIPVNLAIIGAKQGSRFQCVIRGLLYGLGMAAAYGILGLIAVLTGSSFGAIDSSWWFNAGVAVIFILLGLSLFDVFLFDLSRYRSGFRKQNIMNFSGIFLMGGVTALLAGACVAPVVAAMLLQAGKMYNSGEFAGLFLPFVLGLGMALPWPLAAGGLAILPKPGSWMKYVKYSFGIIIIGIGIYYGVQSWFLFIGRHEITIKAASDQQILTETLKKSAITRKPVLIDFRADWCKNCLVMEHRVFPDPAVKKELERFYVVKFDATAIRDPRVESVLKRFSVTGLPTFLIVQGKQHVQ